MSDHDAKQQIIDLVRDVDNVLVTVNRNPTVDELSAALGVTLLINKLNKHATAVFSGDIPPAITFLDPAKTFENTVDSLRDFIIALDKEKADHLRYKVDGDMVKIFITPYRTTISESDLDFSQGDYNVEMVIAIGVQSEDDLDKALSEHGRIMHDATVASVSNGEHVSKLGTINWNDAVASSYSEMISSLTEGLRNDKNLLDEQIATAFLTGIVAATDRFSNQRTSSRTMTVAAELMAAGANQQLIASKLEEADEIGQTTDDSAAPSEDLSHIKVDRSQADNATTSTEEAADDNGSISISHERSGDVDEVADQVMADRQKAATVQAEEELAESLANAAASGDKPSVADIQKDLKAAEDDIDQSIQPLGSEYLELPRPELAATHVGISDDTPTLGGVLNATSEQAADDKRKIELQDQNKTILSHDGAQYVGNLPDNIPPLNSYDKRSLADKNDEIVDPAIGDAQSSKAATIQPLNPVEIGNPVDATVSPAAEQQPADVADEAPLEDIQAAVNAALNGDASQPPVAPVPETVGVQPSSSLPPLPPMPDFSTLPPLEAPADLPPLPEAAVNPEELLSSALGQPASPPVAPPPASSDPNQFQIPGQ